MSFNEEKFVRLRPFLYHTTSENNLDGIRRERRLQSAGRLLEGTDNSPSRQERRLEARCLPLAEGVVWLQTQRPLHRGNIALQDGYTFEAFLDLLNSKVFFWPGRNEHGPIDYGIRHKEKNSWPGTAVMLRVGTDAMINPQRSGVAQYCPYNSGAPRATNGRKSPRGSRTFLPAESFERNPGDVIEVVFNHAVDMPDSTQLWDEEHSFWVPLFA